MRLSTVLLSATIASLACAGVATGCSSTDETTAGTAVSDCAPTEECKKLVGPTESACLALTDNGDTAANPVPGLRISQLTITQPTALSSGAVGPIVASGVALSMVACNLTGTGTFSWLLQFDGGKLKTGGAKPVADPQAGYCFVNETVAGQAVTPITVDAPLGADGSFAVAAADAQDIIVPIYLDVAQSSVVLLPLNEARLYDGTLSADKNCVGKYNADGLGAIGNNCLPDPEVGVTTFVDGAKLEGYVTLEQADGVIVDLLSESLCVLLAPNQKDYNDGGSPKKCKRDADGKIAYAGDWCAATNAAATADCADAVKLGATFAASAVKINGDCE